MAFSYSSAFSQFFLQEKHKYEYHINVNNKILQAYYDNTNCNFFNIIEKYIKNKWDDIILELNHDNRENKEYIWIHINLKDHKDVINKIIDDLNEKYIDEWRINTIPKLISQICNQLKKSEKFFAYALCEYQDKYGTEKAKDFLYTYFQDIKRTQLKKHSDYYSDYSD